VVADGDHAAPADESVPPVEAAAAFTLALQESRRRVGQTEQQLASREGTGSARQVAVGLSR
jgi:hypothetical protein